MEERFNVAEKEERKKFSELSKLIPGIKNIEFSDIGSNARWDVKYQIGDRWYIGDIKVTNINSNELYPLSQLYDIKHLIKKHKIEGLYDIAYNQFRIEIEMFHGVKDYIKVPMIPVFIYIFKDNKIAIWNLMKLPIMWDNVNKYIIEDNDFIEVADKKTQMGDQRRTINKYYKNLDIQFADIYEAYWQRAERTSRYDKKFRTELDIKEFTKNHPQLYKR
jgi:hypothetical protein